MLHTKQQNLDKLQELVREADRLAEVIASCPDTYPLYVHKASLVKQVCFEANYAIQELREEE